MKKLKDFSKHEKILVLMLIIAVILFATSWRRISDNVSKVLKIYAINKTE
ncbi:MAG TPA: hypothetical protein PLL66_01950 [Bacteroidales bacterium]|nr:hypothetical protein [Bacteroidales bacterium]